MTILLPNVHIGISIDIPSFSNSPPVQSHSTTPPRPSSFPFDTLGLLASDLRRPEEGGVAMTSVVRIYLLLSCAHQHTYIPISSRFALD